MGCGGEGGEWCDWFCGRGPQEEDGSMNIFGTSTGFGGSNWIY